MRHLWRRSRETELCSYCGAIRSPENGAGNCIGLSRIDAKVIPLESHPTLILESVQEAESLKAYLAIRGLEDGEIARSIARLKFSTRRQTLLEAISILNEDIMDQAKRLRVHAQVTETTSEWTLRVKRNAIRALMEVVNDRPSALENE
jgi:hypothetical protein